MSPVNRFVSERLLTLEVTARLGLDHEGSQQADLGVRDELIGDLRPVFLAQALGDAEEPGDEELPRGDVPDPERGEGVAAELVVEPALAADNVGIGAVPLYGGFGGYGGYGLGYSPFIGGGLGFYSFYLGWNPALTLGLTLGDALIRETQRQSYL